MAAGRFIIKCRVEFSGCTHQALRMYCNIRIIAFDYLKIVQTIFTAKPDGAIVGYGLPGNESLLDIFNI